MRRRFFFLSKAYKEKMLKDYIPEEKKEALEKKMQIVPNGIGDFWLEHQFFDRDIDSTRKRLQQKELNVVCVGQIIKRKNIPALQEALLILKKEGWRIHLDIIGKIVDKAEYEKIISYADTSYHTPVPKEQLIDFYRKNDIFVLPSLTETFGLVYAEAMTQGLPVLYTKGQGFDQQFDDGVVGYPVLSNSPIDIADRIRQAVERFEELNKNSLDVCIVFNWDRICKLYNNLYESSAQCPQSKED